MKRKADVPMVLLDQLLDRDWDFDEMRDKAIMGKLTDEDKALIRSEAHRFNKAEKDLEQLRGKAQNQIHDVGILMNFIRGWTDDL